MVSAWRRARTLALVAALFLAGEAGCLDATAPVERPRARLIDAVTGDAAAALLPDGTFPRLSPAMFGADSLLSPARAKVLAEAFVTEFGPYYAGDWSQDLGQPVILADLHACRPVEFVESPYEPIAAPVSRTARKAYGPWFLVRFCGARNQAILMLAVAALASDVLITGTGLEPFSDIQVSIVETVIPLNWKVPLSAEDAAIDAFMQTGGRVRRVPRAVARVDGGPFYMYWHIFAELPVSLRDSTTGAAYALDSLLLSDDRQRGVAMFRADSAFGYPASSTAFDPVPSALGGGGTFTLTLREESRRRRSRVFTP